MRIAVGLGVLLGGVLLFVSFHYLHASSSEQALRYRAWVKVSTMDMLSFSVAYYEPRTMQEEQANVAYPEMPPINRMGFVYAPQ